MPPFILGAQSAFLAFVIGLAPVLVWLGFWLLEDWRRPEPGRLVLLAFVGGMVAVVFVLPFQSLAAGALGIGFPVIVAWAAIEEVAKFAFAWALVLRRRDVDEPIDFPIYLITVALGFAALENMFFVFNPLFQGELLQSLVTGNLRFIGATLVHVLSAAVVGGALALAYYRELPEKVWYGTIGVILAILLHAFFNFLIILTGSSSILTAFLGVWVGIVFILLVLERVKNLHRPLWWEKMFMKWH